MTEPVRAAWRHSRLRCLCLWLRACAGHSALARFGAFWPAQYARSDFQQFWTRRMAGPQRAGYASLFGRLRQRYGRRLRQCGAVWALLWSHSLPARAGAWLRRADAERAGLTGRLLGSLRRGDLLLGLFCLYLPVDYALRAWGALAALSTYWDEIFLLLALFLAVVGKMRPDASPEPCLTPLEGPLLAFMGLGLFLAGVVSPILGVAVSGYRAVCQYMVWYFVLVRLVRDRRAVRLCCVLLTALGALVALHGVYQYIVGTPIPRSWVSIYEMGVRTRVFSILGSPNVMGDLMVMLAPLAAGLAYAARTTRARLLCWAATGVMCLACLFTFSRGAWLGLAVAVVLFAWLRDRRLLILAGAALVVIVMLPQIADRITFLFTSDFASNNETAGRAARWAYGIDLLMRSDPVFGFGLGRFGGAVAMQNQTLERIRYFYMDNYYLKTLVEMGFVGLIGYLALLATLLWNGFRTLFRVRAQRADHAVACGLLSGMAGVLTHSLFENIFEVPYMNAYFWGLAALLMVVGFRLGADGTRPAQETRARLPAKVG
ncbi:MAG: O-antigen ligase family protein [Oscillospiraceae bacterium]|nr:O-antigen ligase family protein [Oscillospiraceae bacterium]